MNGIIDAERDLGNRASRVELAIRVGKVSDVDIKKGKCREIGRASCRERV